MQITLNIPGWFLLLMLFLTLLVLVFLLFKRFAIPIVRKVIGKITGTAAKRLLADKYTQNIAEMWPLLNRFSFLNLLETSLRAEEGKVITRPLGTPKHFLGFENLMFAPKLMTSLSL